MRFEFGAFGPIAVREERVPFGLTAPVRLLYASDLHLGHWWTARVPAHLLAAARSARPDVILLGGDLADRSSALDSLRELVAALAGVAPVHAIPGNHDERTGVNDVRAAVRAGGGGWLPDDPIEAPVRIDGVPTPDGPRPRVLCAHAPAVFPAAAAAGYDLVLAGHLHGGQCVLSNRGGKQYPAVWFYRWHGLRFDRSDARMLISRGAADAFPFRFNCPREVVLCELIPARRANGRCQPAGGAPDHPRTSPPCDATGGAPDHPRAPPAG